MPVGRLSPGLERLAREFLAPAMRILHRPTLEGVEHLPRDRPFLLVANHSAGIGVAEILCFLALYVTEVGADRRLAGFAHPLGFRVPGARSVWDAMGMVPSTYEAAEATLAEGVPLLVFPGGDHETLRPIWQAHRVDFGGRRGFLRVARKDGVPIVPMGIAGSHFTAPMLFRARWLAWLLVLPRLMGQKRWGLSLLGLVVAVAIALIDWSWPFRLALIWLWLGSILSLLPIFPATIRFRVGSPLEPEELFRADDEDLSGALRRTETAVQRLVDAARDRESAQ